jgi:hypothetical protein
MIAYCFDRMFDSRFPVASVNETVSRRALDGREARALELQKSLRSADENPAVKAG